MKFKKCCHQTWYNKVHCKRNHYQNVIFQ
jgi:hypothetical protein